MVLFTQSMESMSTIKGLTKKNKNSLIGGISSLALLTGAALLYKNRNTAAIKEKFAQTVSKALVIPKNKEFKNAEEYAAGLMTFNNAMRDLEDLQNQDLLNARLNADKIAADKLAEEEIVNSFTGCVNIDNLIGQQNATVEKQTQAIATAAKPGKWQSLKNAASKHGSKVFKVTTGVIASFGFTYLLYSNILTHTQETINK